MAVVMWVIVKWLAIGVGILCSLAGLGVGVLTVAAMVMGGECEDEEDQNRLRECRQMYVGLERGMHHRNTENTEKTRE
ncbi:MAG: hypothetical protein ABFE13_24830 [Phycisphaerales bacterium]